jgi:hypothetical protein
MSETEYVEVYVASEDAPDTARELLDAAGDERYRVETITGGFRVPKSIADRAGLKVSDEAVLPRETAREGGLADSIINADLASGVASPESVGAVFAQNAPDRSQAQLDAAVAEGEQADPDARFASQGVTADLGAEPDTSPPARGISADEQGAGAVSGGTAGQGLLPPADPAQPGAPTSGEGAPAGQGAGQGEQQPEELRGEALDQALEDAGLPKSGTADEKRARLAQRQGTMELKGEQLEQALEQAGLPKTGSADEKRARLAEHQAKSGS